MRLRRLDDGLSLLLPDDLLWVDEHTWTPAVASVSYLLTGSLLVETASRQRGRPITLAGSPDMGWTTRAAVNQLHAWASVPGQRFDLTLADGRLFTVGFRHHETPIEAEPVTGFAARYDSDFYRITLRLMEV